MSAGFHMEDEAHQRPTTRSSCARLMGYVKPYKAWFSVAVVLLFVASIIGNFTPLIVMKAIDTHVNNPVRMEKEQSVRNAPTTTRGAGRIGRNETIGSARVVHADDAHLRDDAGGVCISLRANGHRRVDAPEDHVRDADENLFASAKHVVAFPGQKPAWPLDDARDQ